MKWSQLKKRIMEFVIPELAKRINFHVTCYHGAHDEVGEFWITLDKEKIFGGGYCHYIIELHKLVEENIISKIYGYDIDFFSSQIKDKEKLIIMEKGIHDTSHFTQCLFNYLNTPVSESLTSNNPIYQAFAYIDKRVGKRRFEKIGKPKTEHKLVQEFYRLRKELLQ